MRNINIDYFALSELHCHYDVVSRGDAPRCAQRLPLAIIFRAFGAKPAGVQLKQRLCRGTRGRAVNAIERRLNARDARSADRHISYAAHPQSEHWS